MAVDMLVGSFNRLFEMAILVAGDADFVPVVAEVRRLGIAVIVASSREKIADDLIRAADRYVELPKALTPLSY